MWCSKVSESVYLNSHKSNTITVEQGRKIMNKKGTRSAESCINNRLFDSNSSQVICNTSEIKKKHGTASHISTVNAPPSMSFLMF